MKASVAGQPSPRPSVSCGHPLPLPATVVITPVTGSTRRIALSSATNKLPARSRASPNMELISGPPNSLPATLERKWDTESKRKIVQQLSDMKNVSCSVDDNLPHAAQTSLKSEKIKVPRTAGACRRRNHVCRDIHLTHAVVF